MPSSTAVALDVPALTGALVAAAGLAPGLRRSPDGVPMPLASWVAGDLRRRLQAAPADSGAAVTVEPTGRADLSLLVGVTRLPVGEAELVLSDLGRDDGPRWAELRTAAAAGCMLPGTDLRRLDGTGPEMDPGACAVLAAGPSAPPGVSSLVLRDGLLVELGLVAGAVRGTDGAPALAVGDPVDRVGAASPGLVGPGGLRALPDNSGLVVRPPGGRVNVSAARPTAVVADVDVPVQGKVLVAGLQVTTGC